MTERLEAAEALLATVSAARTRLAVLAHRALPFDRALALELEARVGRSPARDVLAIQARRPAPVAPFAPAEDDDVELPSEEAEPPTGDDLALPPAEPEDAGQPGDEEETFVAASPLPGDEEETFVASSPLPGDEEETFIAAAPGAVEATEAPAGFEDETPTLQGEDAPAPDVDEEPVPAPDVAQVDEGPTMVARSPFAPEAQQTVDLDEEPITLDELVREDLPLVVADPAASELDEIELVDERPGAAAIRLPAAGQASEAAGAEEQEEAPTADLEPTTVAELPAAVRAAIEASRPRPAVALSLPEAALASPEDEDEDDEDSGEVAATTVSETPPEVRAILARTAREEGQDGLSYSLGQPRAVGPAVVGPSQVGPSPVLRTPAEPAPMPRLSAVARIQPPAPPPTDEGRWDSADVEVIEGPNDARRPEPAPAAAIQILGVGKARTITPTLELGEATSASASIDVADPGDADADSGFNVGFVEPEDDELHLIPELTESSEDKPTQGILTPDGMVPSDEARVAEADAGSIAVRRFKDAARDAESHGDLQGSVLAWGDVLDLRPSDVEAHLGRGRALVELRDYAAAMSDFQRAEDLAPGTADPLYEMGNLFFTRLEYSKAIPYFDQAIDQQPNHAMAWCRRGICHHHRKNHTQAVADLQKAAALDPDIPGLRSYVNMAINAMQKRRR